MKEFFSVTSLEKVSDYIQRFPKIDTEIIPVTNSTGRIIAEDIISDIDIPGFNRSTMDGYAICAASVYGASESNPAYLVITGSVAMAKPPPTAIGPGEAIRIATGGMLPEGADSVVMIEHTGEIDESTLEVYRSIPPGHNVIEKGEDIHIGQSVILAGTRIRPQETGLLAALGHEQVNVYEKPVIAVISTGDEIVPINTLPGPAQVRDINTYTLSSMIIAAGGDPVQYGIVADDLPALRKQCEQALNSSDMIIISGGSSIGARDLTTRMISELPDSEILVHGISISPGKPTILARIGRKPVWGLPGHVTSAMVVFDRVVRPFIEHAAGLNTTSSKKQIRLIARLTRNIASAQGRIDFIRVKLTAEDKELLAEPILGKSGLLNTMINADGLIEIDINTEGLDKDSIVSVIPF